MLKTILPNEMKALETAWMQETGVPSILLMECAARAVVEAIARHAPPGAKVLFLCGPGNNGGDGYAAARLWQERGGISIIWELSAQAKGDAATMRFLAEQAGAELHCLADDVPTMPRDCACVVDALFGTGLSKQVSGAARQMICAANVSGKPIIAVDIPSGLHGATGEELGEAIRAAETVSFHRPKPGLYLRKGCIHSGRVTVAPILIPRDYGEETGLSILQTEDLPALLPARSADAHKGSYGRVVMFAGSSGMAGAAALCAKACVKAGAGLTTVLCRASVLPIVQGLCPGATCRLLPEENDRLAEAAADIAREALQGADRAAVGPGLGQTDDLLPILRVFREAACPVVWDADALNLLAAYGETEALLPLKAEDTITPHPGEAARLLKQSTAWVTEHPMEALEALHERCGCRVVLKGARTLITDGRDQAINATGTPALAKGGSGDILTGILVGLPWLTEDDTALERLQAAVLLHALAGLRAAKLYGEANALPEDVVGCVRTDE